MVLNQAVRDGKAQAGPLADIFRCEERLEHMRDVLRRDPFPLIFH